MINKKFMILVIFLVSLLAVSAVSAADNATEDIVGVEETTDDVVGVDENQTISEGDVLRDSPGTFTDLANEIANAKSTLNLNRDYVYSDDDSDYKDGIEIYKSIVINGNGFTINGNDMARPFYISASDVVLSNIAFVNCLSYSRSGAVYLIGDHNALSNCSFESCTGDYGGAVCLFGDYNALSNCSFVKCHTDWAGGAGYLMGDHNALSNCSFESCTGDIAGSGAIHWEGDNGVLSDSSFMNCSANYGGAIDWFGGNGSLTNCSFEQCTSIDDNVISWTGDYGNMSKCDFINCGNVMWEIREDRGVYGNYGTITDCTFINCTSHDGGAIKWESDYGVLTNCNFVNSNSYSNGGAVSWGGANGVVIESSFMNCHAKKYGGGIYFEGENCSLIYPSFEDCVAQEGSNWYSVYNLTVIGYNKTSTVITAPDVITTYDTSSNLVSTLRDIDNNVIPGEKISIVLNNKEYKLKTNSNGQASIAIPTDLVPKTYIATIRYMGNDNYSSSTAAANVVVNKAGTALTAGDVTTVYNCGKNLVATLKDANGKVISKAQVKIMLNDVTKTLTTDAYGQVSLTTDGLVPNTYNANITFAGNSIYEASRTTAKVTINKAGTTLTATDMTTVYNSGEDLVATLKDANGNVIMGGMVAIKLGYVTKISPTNNDGKVSISTRGLVPNTYTATITFEGNSAYKASSTTVNVTVNKLDSRLMVNYDANNKNIIATVKDANGYSISGMKVGFAIDKVKYVTTDVNGRAEYSVNDFDEGSYSVKVMGYGNEIYKNSNKKTIKFNLTKISTTLTASDIVTDYNGGKNFTATLEDANGKAVKDAMVTLKIGSVTRVLYTDAKGQVSLSTDGLLPDIYTATATFGGDDTYKNSSATVWVTVNKLDTILTSKFDADSKNIIAVVKDTKGNPVNGVKVGFDIDGVEYIVTDADGQAEYYAGGLDEKAYIVDVMAYGNEIYKESNIETVKFDLTKISTILTAEYDANSKNIVATVKDSNGNPIKGLRVGFALNGVKYATTDANGQAKYSTAGLADGTYNVNVQASGNEIYKDSNKETVTFTIGSKEMSKIFLRNALYFVTQTKLVQVTLWDGNNQPLAGKTVYIRAYDSVWHGVTDENGDAFVRVGIGFGTHDATVSFDGDDQYNASTRAGYIRVIKQTPSVMVRGADTMFKASDNNKVVKVHLRDRYDKALPEGSKIVLKLNGKTYVGTTDINGVASIKISINTVGTFTAQAMYGGNTAYNAVTRDVKIRIV